MISLVNKFWCCLPKKRGGNFVANFPTATFEILFLHDFKLFFNILAIQNKNNSNQNLPFSTKFSLLGQTACRGDFRVAI